MRGLPWRGFGLLLLAAMLVFALWTLGRRPMLGMADNGDFWRITQSIGLAHAVPLSEFKQNFVRCTFLYAQPRWEKLMSSAALVAGSARALMRVINPAWFDLRSVGLLYWMLLVAGVVAALWGGIPLLLLVLWVWILVDPNYLLMFNSFYTEPLLLLSVAGIGALLASGRWQRRGVVIGLCVLSLLGATTKAPYALLPLTVVCSIVGVYGVAAWKRLWPLAVIACIPPALFALVPSDGFRALAHINQFNTIFFGVAEVSPAPSETLARFGIPPAYHGLAGKHFFQVDDAIYTDELADHLRQIPLWRIAAFYASQPSALAHGAGKVAKAMTVSRTRYPGHFEYTPGARAAEYTVPWQFSLPRDRILAGRPWLIAVFLAASAAWIVSARARGAQRGLLTAQVFLWMTIVSQAVIAVVGDGFFGLERHLILARFAGDLLCGAIVVDAVLSGADRTRESAERLARRDHRAQRVERRPASRRKRRSGRP